MIRKLQCDATIQVELARAAWSFLVFADRTVEYVWNSESDVSEVWITSNEHNYDLNVGEPQISNERLFRDLKLSPLACMEDMIASRCGDLTLHRCVRANLSSRINKHLHCVIQI